MADLRRRVGGEATVAAFRAFVARRRFRTVLADPPWRFSNFGGRVAPESKRLFKYPTLGIDEIAALPVAEAADTPAHLYLWVPNALVREGLRVLEAWGFEYMTNLVWKKTTAAGDLHRGGMGWYFRNATELVLFGVRGKSPRTLAPARAQPNLFEAPRTGHSQKPDDFYDLVERCSPGPYLELFARRPRAGWSQWGNEMDTGISRLIEEFGDVCERRGRLQAELAVLDERHASLTASIYERIAAPVPAPPPSIVATAVSAGPGPARTPRAPKKSNGSGWVPSPDTARAVEALKGVSGGLSKANVVAATGLSEKIVRHALAAAVRAGRVLHRDDLYTVVLGR